MPVLNAPNPSPDRPLDRGRRIGMHSDISIAIGGGLDAGAKLELAEGQHIQRGARR